MRIQEDIKTMLRQVKYLSEKTNKRSVLILLQHTKAEQIEPCVPKVRESISNVIGFVSLGDLTYVDFLMSEAKGIIDTVVMDVDPKRSNSDELCEYITIEAKKNGMTVAHYSDYASWVSSALTFMEEVEQHEVYRNQHVLIGKNPLATRMVVEFIARGINVWVLKDEYSEMCFPIAHGTMVLNSPYIHYWEGKKTGEKIYLLGCEMQTQSAYLDEMTNVAFDALFDVGISNFSPAFIESARAYGAKVYRSDDRAGISSAVINLMETEDLVANHTGRTCVGGITLVSGGCVGAAGDIVVDNYQNPSTIFGVAAGDGTFRTDWTELDKKNVEKIQKLL